MRKKIKIIVVDDQQLFRDGIIALLKDYDFEIIGSASNGKVLFEIMRTELPNVILLDVEMPEMNGHEAIKTLTKDFPQIAVIVISQYDEYCFTNHFLSEGAIAVFKKDTSIDLVAKAVMNYQNHDKNIRTLPKNLLSTRELEVMHLLSLGLSNKEIANALHLSEKTIENHREHLYKKTHSHSSAQFFKYVFKNGLDLLE
jgi:DNA-binding NarL/FixJ family response regulator